MNSLRKWLREIYSSGLKSEAKNAIMSEQRQRENKFKIEAPIHFKGKAVEFQDEGTGAIADETEDSLYIISKFFTGWMLKAEYFDLLGVED